jgi:hypothetical protein
MSSPRDERPSLDLTGLPVEQALELGRQTGELVLRSEARAAATERARQAAYLYSIIQSAENSECGGPEGDVEVAYDAGILYAARMVLDNAAGENDWRADLYEYADEIRSRTVPGTPLPGRERKVFDAAIAWREAVRDDLIAVTLTAEGALVAAVDDLEAGDE